MISLEIMTLSAVRQTNGDFHFTGIGKEKTLLSTNELRIRLFAWHRHSFYGATLGGKAAYEDNLGLYLSPYTALHYLASDSASLHGEIKWEATLLVLKKAAVIFMEALSEGWFIPSFDDWKQGRTGWKLLLPKEKEPDYEQLLYDAEQLDITYLRDWFQSAANELLQGTKNTKEAWEELCTEKPMLDHSELAVSGGQGGYVVSNINQEENKPFDLFDEEEWLVSIGWKQDDVPFKVCIQLVVPNVELEWKSPKADGEWHLNVLLQDKHDSNMLYEIQETYLHNGSIPKDLPEHWRRFYEERLTKDIGKLLRIVPMLNLCDSQLGSMATTLTDDSAWMFMEESSLLLLKAGYSLLLPSWWEEVRMLRPKLKAQLKSSVGSGRESLVGLGQLMQFDWKIAIGGMELSEDEFMKLASEKKRMMFIRGRWIQLDPAFLEQIRQAMKKVDKKRGISFRDVLQLQLLGGRDSEPGGSGESLDADGALYGRLQIQIELNKHMRKLMNQLQQTKQIPQVQPPASLHADLRSYQLDGLSWLLFLRKCGLGACLADDMGLGKTIQFISYLLQIREGSPSASKKQGTVELALPALLICPTSVLGNWQKELQRFAPTLQIHLHYGSQRAKGDAFMESIRGADLVMSTYSLAQMDEEELSGVQWDCICLDEAQNIKNAYTKQSASIRRLKANHRIALTGTPIENRLTELWSIFDFINPGYLGSLKSFTHTYVNPVERDSDVQLTGQVQKLIRPLLLRRVKKDPAIQLDLPDKNEMKAYVSLTVEQGALYENVVQSLMDKIDTLTGIEKKGLILATLTKLKRVCDHPALLLKENGQVTWEDRSSKMMRLFEMIDELREEGDKCLIFTQYIEMGHMLQVAFEQVRGEPVQFLHGGVPKAKRDEMIERFQNSTLPKEQQCSIFILSLKAGGTGLNLTAANHVFHFDRWWNPAVENQATDRAFRIGQTKDVQVHKFVTLGTLEERIDEMIERKQGLSQQIIGTGENWVTEMSTDELRELFVLRQDTLGK
ncbi:DEAD/DEAH box helicase [Paenibacillus radicis (ex Xue et al. 2023)]|uniref:DEAD/DEAH box helicase n=1 Tax=Paenibacillus radicis (ex Xue et al. 2023) TaxID=2972489 RepID=A0ABT1YS17_9BACL|nr:DEAD/DEAH box helicase [Paenibacillus radicis (ex Xue et al. 2023)]MCR8635965.1 DEAD/DEAH box helicase [Paenibacillus radicis (ex Xue et al. 2023)]